MKYRTIVADPPWRYATSRIVTTGKQRRAEAMAHYDTMTAAEIAALPIGDLAEDDAHLYLWATCPLLFEALPVAEAWGFEYKTLLTWEKQGTLGMGFNFRVQTEHVLFCTRGDAPIPPEKRQRNIFAAPKGQHSAKPDSFYDLVEYVSPSPRVELFARRARFGWNYWGDESLGTVELRGDSQCSLTGKPTRQLREDCQVGVQPDAMSRSMQPE